MVVVTPANAKGPVPVLMMFGRAALPAPAQPPQEMVDASTKNCDSCWRKSDPDIKAIFDQYPAYEPTPRAAARSLRRPRAPGTPPSDRPRRPQQLIARRLGLCRHQSSQHSGRQRRRPYARHHRSGQQRPAAQAGRLGLAASLGLGRGARTRLSRNRSRGRCQTRRHRRRLALRQGSAGHAWHSSSASTWS